ncbi:phage head morphogenesis protein [Pandoraea communis]|uniref:Phage head morphogenesis protein n=1 Tax=Pandoraea communis TaxID=2508297 RepID=A0A5E4TSJ3_9BURK|nr:phage minor head protein [Pandoraea communis]VVD90737.1 phage head morphogenesis protein [Pandoraea communis]
MKKPRPKIRGVQPNLGVEQAYRAKLDNLVRQMQRSYLYWLRARYRENEDAIAMDDSPSSSLMSELASLSRQWKRMFAKRASQYAREFVAGVDKHSTYALKKEAARVTGLSVSVKDTLTSNDVMQALIKENVSLIKSIQSEYHTQVEGIVMRSVSNGRDLSAMTDDLQKRYGVTRRRAKLIANDQNNKATSNLMRVRQADLGITQGRWLHTGGGKEPRQSHVRASGKVFDLSKGMYLDGKWTMPGEEINCGCTWEPIIEGVND